ncbi:hypothetical protein [Pontibacter actiniarum]|uniref:Uncharacterized protein n=1 Tax=Pontibacter actiniarum TaxID=323450 RepID=A0A1X9YSH8_9BACT|nr:hypothetical protein [Pontibacter actiniarum]ARS35784.1 hypothetical protein CA264_10210 [Pontibacter actiniarum]
MELGKYYEANQRRFNVLTDNDWRAAIKKCKEHLNWKLKQKTLFGAHSPANLGADPKEYYLSLALEKILAGSWEWQTQFSLSQQLIRLIDSLISKEVERVKTQKSENLKIEYRDIEVEFYDLGDCPDQSDREEKQEYERQVQVIEDAVQGDQQLQDFWEAVQAGYKRSDMAEHLGITPKQLDKVKEKLLRRVSALQPSNK